MILTRQELDNLRVISNTVVFKPEKILNEGYGKGTIKIFLNTSENHEIMFHIGVFGYIIKQPERLIFEKKITGDGCSMPWLTDIETKVGDRVIVTYTSIYEALEKLADKYRNPGNPRWFICEDEVYAWLHYKDLVCVVGSDLKPLNGHLLVEVLDDEATYQTTLILPESLKKKANEKKFARVIKAGSINRDYQGDYCGDSDDVHEGDIVIFDKHYNIELEHGIHQQLDKHYYRIQRRNLQAIVPESMWVGDGTLKGKITDLKLRGQ